MGCGWTDGGDGEGDRERNEGNVLIVFGFGLAGASGGRFRGDEKQ